METEAVAYRMRAEFDRNEAPDGYVIYDERRGKVIFLNQTAAAVLEMCDGSFTQDEIVGVIQSVFDLLEAPTQDVAACLKDLMDEEIIEPCRPS